MNVWLGRLVAATATAMLACAGDPSADTDPSLPSAPPPGEDSIVVNDRSNVIADYPCSRCHDKVQARPVKRPPRTPHSQVKVKHMDTAYECYQCHSENDMDRLVLQDGSTVGIGESHILCGECHSLIKRDWDVGIHGKQSGSWLGTKHRYTCADCHRPHSPKIRKMKASPPPPRPKLGIDKGH